MRQQRCQCRGEQQRGCAGAGGLLAGKRLIAGRQIFTSDGEHGQRHHTPHGEVGGAGKGQQQHDRG
ncbi:MAG: hypothetical protein DI591_03640 [Citromicrobium sp.]|nr:MAG: hypothetical protein DI591_03640 [Citromicrobium sp.]